MPLKFTGGFAAVLVILLSLHSICKKISFLVAVPTLWCLSDLIMVLFSSFGKSLCFCTVTFVLKRLLPTFASQVM